MTFENTQRFLVKNLPVHVSFWHRTRPVVLTVAHEIVVLGVRDGGREGERRERESEGESAHLVVQHDCRLNLPFSAGGIRCSVLCSRCVHFDVTFTAPRLYYDFRPRSQKDQSRNEVSTVVVIVTFPSDVERTLLNSDSHGQILALT